MSDDKKEQDYMFEDLKEFYSKFIFTPDFKEYEHLTKDVSVTNLRSKFKEPEQVRGLLEAFHILSNKKYFNETTKNELSGYREENVYKLRCESCDFEEFMKEITEGICPKCGEAYLEENIIEGIIQRPVYNETKVLKSKFPKIHHFLLSKFISIIITSQARDGHLMRTFHTRRMEKEESIEDKTDVKASFFPGMQGKKRSGGGGV